MSDIDVDSVMAGLARAAARYPGCRIANCDCNSKNGKWSKGCWCMCHFRAMDEKYGKDKWDLNAFVRELKVGR